MAVCNKYLKRVIMLISTIFIIMAYQNCGKSVFRIESLGSGLLGMQGPLQVVDVDCSSATGCNSTAMPAGSSSSTGSSDSLVQLPSHGMATNGMPASLLNSQALENTNSEKLINKLYNFVADSKELCEEAVSNALGKKINCNYAAGCGLGCGKPNFNCESANPDKWGACVEVSE